MCETCHILRTHLIFTFKNISQESGISTPSFSNGGAYADFDNDGFEDLIYVCGDNADITPILKSYHGIYIFLNDDICNPFLYYIIGLDNNLFTRTPISFFTFSNSFSYCFF